MRLLTAHSDGSLGVWSLKETGFTAVTSSPTSEPPSLSMEEPPTMPYGPFPCKLISKVFWLSSPSGGITAFVGGMPRATYGQRHTVSLLRGSNLDRAAAANVAAARIAAATEADDYDDEDDGLLDSSFVSNTPMHVFDPDAPEHVCFDLPSRLVDLLPVGPVGGPAQLLLLLCEEELVAVDLLSPGWPFMRPPYLACLHTAAVTTYTLVTQVNPHLLAQLDAAGAYYGPEGRFGRGSALSSGPNTAGWSQLPWPIQGGQALVSGSRLSSSPVDDSLLFTDDLLLTGHEDGSVAFWRLSAGGCVRRVYTLHSAVLFDGDFGLPNHTNDLDEDADSWPPFRQAGVFDPFMDDNRAAVHLVRLVDNTLAVGGAAGQVTVWQFLDSAPPLTPVYAQIKTEIPGFKWKGHAPLKLRAGLELGSAHTSVHESRPPAQLQPVGVVFAQPPARCTALSLTEIRPHSMTTKATNTPYNVNAPPGVVVALGTPHGYTVIYLPPVKPLTSNTVNPSPQWAASVPQLLVSESTLPDNIDALQEAAAGEGWARRRTRELKNSLRDSFRRLKRMRSTKKMVPVDATSSSGLTRAGLQRTITQSHRPSGRPIDSDPLEEAELRAKGLDHPSGSGLPPISIEREICDRSLESASTAIVSYFTFGPPMFRFSSSNHHTANQPVGSLFIGTKSGTVKAYALFADRDFHSTTQMPSTFRIQLAKQLILQHRAPILNLRLVDSKSFHPWSTFGTDNPFGATTRSPVIPSLLVVSEEQVRLFGLPTLRLRYKARITAKDGYRIKCGALVSFRQTAKMRGPVDKIGDDSACGDLDRSIASTVSTPSHQLNGLGDMQSSEFSFVFTNVGGQAVVLNMPQLMRKDTFGLLDSNDVVAVSSVVFAEHGTSGPPVESTVIAPSLGLYQLAPGQLTLFDIVRTGQRASLLGASYKPIQRLPDSRTTSSSRNTAKPHPVSGAINGSTTADSSGFSSRILPPRVPKHQPLSLHSNTNAAGCSASYAGSQVNSSMLSNTLSDSVRDCFTSPSDSSFASDRRNDHYEAVHAPRNSCNR
ncbi:hypothetical protein AHF37_02313 [Paragonimus kellicotti]|nr:hypothetical protein AHF37_02313 [Paragonimus kellicotti]